MLKFLKSWRVRRGLRRKKGAHFFLLFLMFAYLLFLLWLLLVYGRNGEEKAIPSSFSIIPFAITSSLLHTYITFEYNTFYLWMIVRNILGNIIIFLPLGCLGKLLVQKSSSSMYLIILFFLLSISLECLQYALKVGIFDIDDIIYNSLGAWIGIKLVRD